MRGGGFAGVRGWCTAALTLSLVPALAIPAGAAPEIADPLIGDCYEISFESSSETKTETWPDADPVPCEESHTFEVTRTGALPDDGDLSAYAADQCGELGVWNQVGVNRTLAGIIRRPLRIEARSFVMRGASKYVCGAVAVQWSSGGVVEVIPSSSAIEDMTPRERGSLQYCSAAERVRRPRVSTPTVSCTSKPRWEAAAWIVWTAFYDDYPGRAELRARATRLCGAGSRVTVPKEVEWSDAVPRSWCFRRYP